MKEKKTGELSVSCIVGVFSVVAISLISPLYAVSATAAIKGGMNFDIPISELNKGQKESAPKRAASEPPKKNKSDAKPLVKKESSPKRIASKPKKKKKGDSRSQRSIASKAHPIQHADQAKFSGSALKPVVPGEAVPSALPGTSAQPSENIRIDHSPYTFVVAGKTTVIHAVIYKEETDLQAVNCKVLAAETGVPSLVKMAKVNGTRFTYTANLPGPTPDSSSLRYTIVAVDSLGKESISSEFVTPVTSSPVMPGWQF